jgi:hypothetical protein
VPNLEIYTGGAGKDLDSFFHDPGRPWVLHHCVRCWDHSARRILCYVVLLAIFISTAAAQSGLPLPNGVPEGLGIQLTTDLNKQRSKLLGRRTALIEDIAQHNSMCSAVPTGTVLVTTCTQERSQLVAKVKEYSDAVGAFNRRATIPQFRGEELVRAMEEAERSLKVPKNAQNDWSKRCSAFFAAVGAQLGAEGPEWKPGTSADRIIKLIRKDHTNWRPVGEAEVQNLANDGVLVIGAAYDIPHGHIALAFPVSALTSTPGHGPFIRDGNVHRISAEDRVFASSWGALKASKAFNYSRHAPEWYVWMSSEHH